MVIGNYLSKLRTDFDETFLKGSTSISALRTNRLDFGDGPDLYSGIFDGFLIKILEGLGVAQQKQSITFCSFSGSPSGSRFLRPDHDQDPSFLKDSLFTIAILVDNLRE